jgi:hypothetical protein
MLHPAHVALIDQTGQVPKSDLASYASALTKYAMTKVGPVWHARAQVTVATVKPAYAWGLYIQEKLDQPGALGYHSDKHNQPVMYVELTNDVSVTLSHELGEACADQQGSRLHPPTLPPQGVDLRQLGLQPGDPVQILVEIADMVERETFTIDGIPMSDFGTGAWYSDNDRGPYSYTGSSPGPRVISDGGYVSFARMDGEWFQAFNEGGQITLRALGKFSRSEGAWSLREWVDSKAREYRGRV